MAPSKPGDMGLTQTSVSTCGEKEVSWEGGPVGSFDPQGEVHTARLWGGNNTTYSSWIMRIGKLRGLTLLSGDGVVFIFPRLPWPCEVLSAPGDCLL